MIKLVGCSDLTLIEKYRMILDMDPGDFSFLSNYIETNGMGIKPYMNVKCNKCGGMAPLGITFQASFLFPNIKS